MRIGWRSMRITLIVAVLVGSIDCFAPTTPTAAEALAPTYDQAVVQLQLYVRYLKARDFVRAYRLRSAAFQEQRSFTRFVTQFNGIAATDIVVLAVAPTGDQTTVFLLLSSVFEDGTTRVLRGTYAMGFENGRTRIFGTQLVLNTTESG